MLTNLQYRIIKAIAPGGKILVGYGPYHGRSKVKILFGDDLARTVAGKEIIDFGCGEGTEAVELAQSGAKRVIGIDLRESVLAVARERAAEAGVAHICTFTTSYTGQADLIVSIDAFEHFEDPPEILRIMEKLLRPDGDVYASFGPTWYHPLGGHLFSVFPWAHLLFTEKALIRWRSDFKTDGATKFSETSGGLNQMSIARFERTVAESPFRFEKMEAVPIRKLRRLHNRWTREFTATIVRCRLKKRSAA